MIRREVFYSKNDQIQAGDEYYEIVLDTKTEHRPETKFRVAIFHGRAADGNREPESEGFYARRDEAESGLNWKINELLQRGFQRYDPAIHGVHGF